MLRPVPHIRSREQRPLVHLVPALVTGKVHTCIEKQRITLDKRSRVGRMFMRDNRVLRSTKSDFITIGNGLCHTNKGYRAYGERK